MNSELPSPDAAVAERFAGDLDRLIGPDARVGIAVSGGPDSLALLLLAAAARPGQIEAASVDHMLRAGSRAEALMVAEVCAELGVRHEVLTVEWDQTPDTAIQERARQERYRLLAGWAKARRLNAVATAHHLDDQAETLLMRLARGAGVRGLAGMRGLSAVPGSDIPLLRPLLGWRSAELKQVCSAAGLVPAADPGNDDVRFERVRVRRGIAASEWLDPASLAASAAHLGDADAALDWATRREWADAVTDDGSEIVYRPSDAPVEIRRRIVSQAVARLATEGQGAGLKGREIDRLLASLGDCSAVTIRGVRCSGSAGGWRFVRAPVRRS